MLDVKIRANGTDFSNASSVDRIKESYAGYVIPEDSIGNELEDSIICIVE